MLEKLRTRKGSQGFTLVEMIVVLVIIAILVAFLTPTLKAYIDRANQEKVTSQARMWVMALQAEATTAYAAGDLAVSGTWAEAGGTANNSATHYAQLKALAEDKTLKTSTASTGSSTFAASLDKNGNITTLTYYDGSQFTCTYTGATGDYAVVTGASADLTNTVTIVVAK
ncbi:MAG: prepilin-type N-terminal cleavage/methylation domain-containing protein [Gemmiger sp.]|nr:prepilin-type N-terminal cleavage/methylation domain-containing protein [Gemmiger sp.]